MANGAAAPAAVRDSLGDSRDRAAARADAPATLYGHRRYTPAPANALVPVGKYRESQRVVRLRKPAAAAFLSMQKAAKAAGHDLIPISGHRTLEYQKNLFERAKKKQGSTEAAARWVAPPGYSEHHTGYTLDLGDGGHSSSDVETSFEKTPLYVWLVANAKNFGFEISFPRDNAQGVNYEPWHWRYVGDDAARALFHPAAAK